MNILTTETLWGNDQPKHNKNPNKADHEKTTLIIAAFPHSGQKHFNDNNPEFTSVYLSYDYDKIDNYIGVVDVVFIDIKLGFISGLLYKYFIYFVIPEKRLFDEWFYRLEESGDNSNVIPSKQEQEDIWANELKVINDLTSAQKYASKLITLDSSNLYITSSLVSELLAECKERKFAATLCNHVPDKVKNITDKPIYRIYALKSFGHVSRGAIGGVTDNPELISQHGDCWIDENVICLNTSIMGDAYVLGSCLIVDSSILSNTAIIDVDEIRLSSIGPLCSIRGCHKINKCVISPSVTIDAPLLEIHDSIMSVSTLATNSSTVIRYANINNKTIYNPININGVSGSNIHINGISSDNNFLFISDILPHINSMTVYIDNGVVMISSIELPGSYTLKSFIEYLKDHIDYTRYRKTIKYLIKMIRKHFNANRKGIVKNYTKK